MSHPFGLNISDLENLEIDFTESITDAEAANINGGLRYATTKAIGEGGSFPPIKPPIKHPIKPPMYTTLAVGEEGGEVTTLAIGEEGGTF